MGFRFEHYRLKLSAVFRRVRTCVDSGIVRFVRTGIVVCVGTAACVVCIVAVVSVIRFVFVVIIIVVHNLNTILSQLGCAQSENICGITKKF